jgi:diguanylate cyclase (GGDEF)-like protein
VFQTWTYLTIVGVLLAVQAFTGLVVLRLWQMLSRTRHDATHDPTTGLPNRRAVTKHLYAALRAGTTIGLVLLDVDRFKQVNDTHGHERGNDVLKQIGERLRLLNPPAALAARLSGDEFVLIVHGDHDQTASIAWAANAAITRYPVALGDERIAVTASVGYATAGLGWTTRQLMHTADIAMYQAKRYGPGEVYGAPAGTAETTLGRPPRPRDLRPPPAAAHE